MKKVIVAVALGAASLSLTAAAPHAAATPSSFPLDARVGLNAFTSLVEQDFGNTRSALRVVAGTDEARSGDWDRIKRPLAILANNSPTKAAVWFARPDGSYFTVERGLVNETLRDRAYFPALIAGGEVNGALVVSKSTGEKSAIVAVPIRNGSRVIGALGVSVDLEKVAALVEAKTVFPKDVVFYAVNSRGEIALSRQSARLFEFVPQLGSPTLTKAVAVMLAKPEGVVRYRFEGAQRTAIYKRSDATGWVFALRR